MSHKSILINAAGGLTDWGAKDYFSGFECDRTRKRSRLQFEDQQEKDEPTCPKRESATGTLSAQKRSSGRSASCKKKIDEAVAAGRQARPLMEQTTPPPENVPVSPVDRGTAQWLVPLCLGAAGIVGYQKCATFKTAVDSFLSLQTPLCTCHYPACRSATQDLVVVPCYRRLLPRPDRLHPRRYRQVYLLKKKMTFQHLPDSLDMRAKTQTAIFWRSSSRSNRKKPAKSSYPRGLAGGQQKTNQDGVRSKNSRKDYILCPLGKHASNI